jgi:4-amino-4-deoxy-L-arabinose transferase-like glycosyltransferase
MVVESMLLSGFNSLVNLLYLGLLVLSIFALVHAAMQREDAFRATDKQTKPFWLIILGISVAVQLIIPMMLLILAGTIAAIVYIVDVRPAVQAVSKGGRGGSSSDGPYGPYNGGR